LDDNDFRKLTTEISKAFENQLLEQKTDIS